MAVTPDQQQQLQQALLAFCDVAATQASEVLQTPPNNAATFTNLHREVSAFSQSVRASSPPPPDLPGTVRDYFAVPNHYLACGELDYRLFSETIPLCVANNELHIHHILLAFSGTDASRYAMVWLPLLSVAELACPPSAFQSIQSARQHLLTQNHRLVAPTTASSEAGADFDRVMQSFLGSFPGLQTMVQQILSGGSGGGGDGLSGILNQVQAMMQPLLTQASSDPNGPDLQPAVQQILQGFSGLTQALAASAQQPPPPPPPAGEMEQ